MAPAADLPARLLAAASLLLGPAGALADEPAEWLGRMDQALRELSYEGLLVYVHGGAVESLKLIHTRDGDRQRERDRECDSLPHGDGDPNIDADADTDGHRNRSEERRVGKEC